MPEPGKKSMYVKPAELVKRDVHGRVRHAWAREAKVVNCDPEHCKGVWKPPPDKHVNKTSGTGLAGAVQRANAEANKRAAREGKQPAIRDIPPDGAVKAHKLGRHHQANLQQMRELQRRKMDEPRPATVPAMHVAQPNHVQQYFDRAAHHGELAKDVRKERQKQAADTLRQPDDRTQRAGHTQHRTVQDIDCRMDDVWGAMNQDRGMARGQLAGHSFVDPAKRQPTKIYVGNVPPEAGAEELKEVCGLREQHNLLCDPATAEDKGVFWVERKANCAVIHVPDKRTAQRIVKYCKSRRPKLQGRLLRVDEQNHDDSNMQWTGIGARDHKPAGGDWSCEDRQGGCRADRGSNSIGGQKKSYELYESEYNKQFASGLQYDINNIANFMRRHPAKSKAYPSCAEGRRRGAQGHGPVLWYPWMPAWEKGAPVLRGEWLPTPSFPGGGDGDPPMPDKRMRLKQRRNTPMGHGGGPKSTGEAKPKLTKQQENAGKSATQKKAEQQAKKAAKNEKAGNLR